MNQYMAFLSTFYVNNGSVFLFKIDCTDDLTKLASLNCRGFIIEEIRNHPYIYMILIFLLKKKSVYRKRLKTFSC